MLCKNCTRKVASPYFAKCLENNNYNVPSALRAYNRGYDDGHRVYANNVLEYANKWREGETYAVG